MSNVTGFIQTFAGGEFGDAMSARVGIDSYQAACDLQENFFSLAQGPMIRRPSLEFIGELLDSSKKGVLKKFEFDIGQNYLIVQTDLNMEFYLNDGKLDIPVITAVISNGSFSSFTDWTDNSTTGGTAAATGGYLTLTSDGAATAKARTTFAINEPSVLHVLAFDVVNGPINLRVGSAAGGEQFIDFMELRTGHHRLSFTPTGATAHIEFWHLGDSIKRLDNLSLLIGPTFVMPAPWAEADMRRVFTAQDGDRLFMFSRSYTPRVLERRAHQSWSLIDFEPTTGPFKFGDDTVKLTPSARYGEITLTADRDLFSSGDVRRLYRLTHRGQHVHKIARGDTVYSNAIKVTGVGSDRSFSINVAGTFVGTVTLERSISNENNFSKVLTYTAPTAVTYSDSYADADTETVGTHDDSLFNVSGKTTAKGRLDNITAYYRFAVLPGAFTSGAITLELSYPGGTQLGVVRVTAYASATSVTAEVIKTLSTAGATELWEEGEWAASEEWPSTLAFSGGRLWTARRREVWASASDDYFNFTAGTDDNTAIKLTLRSKSAEGVRWMRHLDYLCIGTRNEEYIIRSTSAAAAIGPTTVEPALQGEEGGADVEPVIGGDSIVYIHRARRRAMQFAHNPKALSPDAFISIDLNRLNPEACQDGIVNMAIQQEPERRIFIVLASGICKSSLFRREEDIVAWSTIRTGDAIIEDAVSFTENDADAVYFLVRRKIGSVWKRFIERLGSEVVLNEEDFVHLDCMLQSDISRPDVTIIPSATNVGDAVTVDSLDDAFVSGDVGKVMWLDGGRITIGAYVDARQVTGTVVWPLDGRIDDETDVKTPVAVPGGRWGMATSGTVFTGLGHLNGETVSLWGDKTYLGTAVVSGGSVTLPQAASRVFVGLPMVSRWRGLRLAYGGNKGTAVNQRKSVIHMGAVLSKTADGMQIGQDFKKMKTIVVQPSDILLGAGPRFFSGEVNEAFNGKFATDPRITVKVSTPGPAIIKALIPNVQTNER